MPHKCRDQCIASLVLNFLHFALVGGAQKTVNNSKNVSLVKAKDLEGGTSTLSLFPLIRAATC